MASETMTFHMGTNETGASRREAYEKAAQKAGARSVSEWIKQVCDKAAGFKEPSRFSDRLDK